MLRFSIILSFCILCFGLPSVADAQIYVRIQEDGQREFTNRPSGPGWIFYMTESGYIPDIRFAREGKPKSLDEIVEEIADGFSIDANLVKAIIVVESKCDTMAVSKKGAQGLMQLMPATAKELKVTNVFDARDNVVGGVKYIKGLIASYGNLRLALAAYNAGPGTVAKYAGIPPYRETRAYVEKVLRYCDKFKNDPSLRIAGM